MDIVKSLIFVYKDIIICYNFSESQYAVYKKKPF